MYEHYTTLAPDCQGVSGKNSLEFLTDKTAKGKERPWRDKKMANTLLALAYDDFNLSKAARLRGCGNYLTFALDANGKKKLKHMDSCRVRLCPLCAWRRSLKVHAHTVQILDALNEEYAFVFLTLTVQNCEADKLSATIDDLMAGWQRLMQRKDVKKAVKGWYRGLEVTHNVDHTSESYDTYHPHFHALLCVNKSYFTDRTYISKAAWTQLWMESMRLDYVPVVDVRRTRGNTSKAVAEAAKYTVKDGDYILPDDWELTVETVEVLDTSLENRRLVAYGGLMKELHKQLNLDDEVDGDLINVGESDETESSETETTVDFFWHTGYQQYVKHKE